MTDTISADVSVPLFTVEVTPEFTAGLLPVVTAVVNRPTLSAGVAPETVSTPPEAAPVLNPIKAPVKVPEAGFVGVVALEVRLAKTVATSAALIDVDGVKVSPPNVNDCPAVRLEKTTSLVPRVKV